MLLPFHHQRQQAGQIHLGLMFQYRFSIHLLRPLVRLHVTALRFPTSTEFSANPE